MKQIETKRFILRKTDIKDCDFIFNMLSDVQIVRYLNMDVHKNIYDTKKLIKEYQEGYEKKNKYPYTIITKDTNEYVGVFLIKLDEFDDDCYEFTIYLNKCFWGQGIYTEVLPYMADVAFNEIKTGNFRGFVMEDNVVSSKVLEKVGFKLEKIFKVPNIEGKIKSYLMTKEEYNNLNKSI